MSTTVIKILALWLAFGQVSTGPETVRTAFDPVADQPEVARILQAGCAQIRKAFGIEALDLDELVATAIDDAQFMRGDNLVLRGVDLKELYAAYRAYCTDQPSGGLDLGAVVAFYNTAAANLPDDKALAALRPPELTSVLDGKGLPFAELFEPGHRRVFVRLADVPEHVQNAFIAAEDKRFREHRGVDERGLIRAFLENLARQGRVQGGSTITQQVAKNLLVGADLTYERKIRELIVAAQMERAWSKDRILELYLNSIYLGRGAWGIEMAARSYFGKSVAALSLSEAALLAGLSKGPNYFSPDRNPQGASQRQAYVLDRMKEDGRVTDEQAEAARRGGPQVIAHQPVRRRTGFHFVDEVVREAARSAGIDQPTKEALVVRSTVLPQLQTAAEAALQEGLARYESASGRAAVAPEANIAEAVKQIESKGKPTVAAPAWREALRALALPLYDVHWTRAIVLRQHAGDGSISVGLPNGQMLPLSRRGPSGAALKPYDVVYVQTIDSGGKPLAQAELRVRPKVQGAAIVLDNKSGGVLAMAGGFSYPLSQINRVTQTQRQPGSAFKPVVYLAALRAGLQPNTRIPDEPITLPQSGQWSPKNYDGTTGGTPTLRQAFENSRNIATARLLSGGIETRPQDSLARVCTLAREAGLYRDCIPFYPFVLGAQPLRLIDLAAFYASIANEGTRIVPHVIDSITRNGETVFQFKSATAAPSPSERSAVYQLKTLLQGVVERGTARTMRPLAPYLGGKTGTSSEENDVWFAGFTNDITVAVWIGYDNAGRSRQTLGRGSTGGNLAAPIFREIVEAAWAAGLPKRPLAPPSAEAAERLVAVPINFGSGERQKAGGASAFMEYFRLDGRGVLHDTVAALTSKKGDQSWRQNREAAPVLVAGGDADEHVKAKADGTPATRTSKPPAKTAPAARQQPTAAAPKQSAEADARNPPKPQSQPVALPAPLSVTPRWVEEERARAAAPRIDPDYFWSERRTY